MANYANALSLVLVIMFLATLKVDARESKYFYKLNPQVEQPPSEIKNYNNFPFENHESDIPPEEFIESIKKDFSEADDFSRNFNEHSYVMMPRGYKQKDSNELYYPNKLNPGRGMHASTSNNKFELTAEEKKFFNEKQGMTSHASFNNDGEDVHVKEAQGMSDTRTLENGKFYYNPRAYRNYNEYTSKYDEFRPLKDFEYNSQNQVGFIP